MRLYPKYEGTYVIMTMFMLVALFIIMAVTL